MKSLKINKLSINIDFWAEKSQKEFVDYFSDRVDKNILIEQYKKFGKKKSRKQKADNLEE